MKTAPPSLERAEIVRAQRLLGVAADGEWGLQTESAMEAWRRSRGVAADGFEQLMRDVPLRAVTAMEGWAAEGLEEQPAGSNRVPVLVALAGRLGVAPQFAGMGYPWCAFAVFLAALEAGGETAAAGLRRAEFDAVYTPVVLAEAKAGSFGLRIVAADAFRGDLVLFDWNFAGGDPVDHVARLVSRPAGGRVRTVDGNSGGDGLVALRERSVASVRAFARDS